jgi:hypothetical protein
MNERLHRLERFYSSLERLEFILGAARRLTECSGRMSWPRRGVYFFRETGEIRRDTGNSPRIVRIGTHALKAGSGTNLWTRLSQHRGQASSGGGNHRGSIFRLIVGTALIEKEGHDYPSWGQGNSAPREMRLSEQPLERRVSRVIGDMPLLWVDIGDEPGPDSLRGYIERNTIALLSNFDRLPLDPPSTGWLGHWCNRARVRTSGLWNSNHVDEDYDPAFLDTLDHFIDQMGPTS